MHIHMIACTYRTHIENDQEVSFAHSTQIYTTCTLHTQATTGNMQLANGHMASNMETTPQHILMVYKGVDRPVYYMYTIHTTNNTCHPYILNLTASFKAKGKTSLQKKKAAGAVNM